MLLQLDQTTHGIFLRYNFLKHIFPSFSFHTFVLRLPMWNAVVKMSLLAHSTDKRSFFTVILLFFIFTLPLSFYFLLETNFWISFLANPAICLPKGRYQHLRWRYIDKFNFLRCISNKTVFLPYNIHR